MWRSETDPPEKKVRATMHLNKTEREGEGGDSRMTHVKNAKLLRKEIPE